RQTVPAHKKSNRNPQLSARKRQSPSTNDLRRQSTYGEALDSGCAIDLVCNAQNPDPQLYVFHQGREIVAPEFQIGTRIYSPGDLPAAIHAAVRFPERSTDYGSLEKLFCALKGLLSTSGFEADVALATSFWLLASWFSDVLSSAPALMISGPPTETGFLLDLLSCVARRGLHIGDVTPGDVRSLPMPICPTLLINAGQIDSRCRKLLRITSRRRAFVGHSGKLLNLYCAKAIYCGVVGDFSAITEALHVTLQPIGCLPVLDEIRGNEIAREFQPKLCAYRARNILQVRNSRFDASALTSASRLQARIYGAPLAGNAVLEGGLIPLLQDQEHYRREECWNDFNSIVLEATLHHAHTQLGQRVTVGQIADTANAILVGRGDETKHHAREVGQVLTSFGLRKDRRSNGFTVLLNAAASGHLHRLAKQLGVLNESPDKWCPLCDEIMAARTQQGAEK